MQLSKLTIKGFFFIGLIVILGVVLFRLFAPFLNIILVALVIVQLFYPLYKGLQKLLRSKQLASIITTLSAFAVVVVPIILISALAIAEIKNVVDTVTTNQSNNVQISEQALTENKSKEQVAIENILHPALDQINTFLYQSKLVSTDTPPITVASLARTILQKISDFFVPILTEVFTSGVNILFSLFILTLTLVYLFPAYERLAEFVKRISPLDDRVDELLVSKFTETNMAVVKGTFLVAIAQATAVIIAMILMNFGSPVILWLIMVILSIVPIGSGLVFIPAGAIMIMTGNAANGVFLIVYGIVVINVIDALLRPYLLKETVDLHPMLIILSVIGGISVFGPLGILYGPLVAVFFTSLMEVYNQHFSDKGTHDDISPEISAAK